MVIATVGSQAPRRPPAERRIEPSQRGIDAPLSMMDCFVVHELPRKEREGERGAVPIDRRGDVHGFQTGEQLSLFVLERVEKASRVSGPAYWSCFRAQFTFLAASASL